MESRTHVAHYAATMTRELCRMCRKVELDDLAYLLEVAAAASAAGAAAEGLSAAALTTADDLALSKAISRQHRGGDDFGASAWGGNFPAARRAARSRGAQTIHPPCELAHIS